MEDRRYPAEPQENILYFIEKECPLLEPWQREVVRIVRKISQYFYPQKQTQVMNEGWATFWHYTILNHLYDEGKSAIASCWRSAPHQRGLSAPTTAGIKGSTHALGFAMFTDLRRICEHPTEEDRYWFPDYAGTNWVETLHFAMQNFKDKASSASSSVPR